MQIVTEGSWGTAPLRQPWHSLVLGLIGCTSLVFGVSSYIRTHHFLEQAAHAQGTVIAQHQSGDAYYPIVSYVDRDGLRHRFTGDIGSSPTRYTIGQPVTIVYTPGDPASARIEAFWELWMFTQMGLTFGIAFNAGAVLLWVLRKRLFPVDAAAVGGSAAAAVEPGAIVAAMPADSSKTATSADHHRR